MTVIVYRFGEFRLDPAARELWRGDEPHPLPRLVFDSLVFLVENRDRAVSRDELIVAAWGRSHVEDIQVTQLVMRLRRVLGDDSHAPKYVGTVPGFGYRWIADTDVCVPVGGGEGPPPDGTSKAAGRVYRVAAGLAALSLVLVFTRFADRDARESIPLPREPGEAVAVLPLDVGMSGQEADWVRLGVMDLIAGRLRDAGMPTSPSDSVISALYTTAESEETERDDILRDMLGAGVLVHGTATRTDEQWTIELIATAAGGEGRRVEAGPAEIIPAARQAAEMLLAALGHDVSPPAGDDDSALSELLQRSRAAALALELDTARSFLDQAPESLRGHPELLYDQAQIEFNSGRLDEAGGHLSRLLATPALQPRLRARALTLRGIVAVNKQDDWAAGIGDFDAAIAVLENEPWAPELGTALALRGGARLPLHDFAEAARDLGRARALFEVSGDRQGVARIYNYFGNLELQRHRPGDALPDFRTALEIFEAYGNVDGVRANLIGVLLAEQQLLRWPDALETGSRLWSLRERIRDPLRRHYVEVAYADLLISVGRLREAEAILDEWRAREAALPPRAVRNGEKVRAKLAWEWGRSEEALQVATRFLERWPAPGSPTAARPVELVLLRQRAAIAGGRATPDLLDPTRFEGIGEESAYLVARAEQAAFDGERERAERLFLEATVLAEGRAVPAELVLVADAYARWLLDHGRVPEALAPAGRVADWAESDYDAALLQAAVYHAGGRREAWEMALQHARRLAGDRPVPADLLQPPP